MIDIQHLVFEYPGHRALDDVSLHIPAGSVTALVGPNGAGKSTLLRCIAGLDQPLAGHIVVNGVAVHEHPREVHQHLGYLSDFVGLYDSLSVRRCLQYAAMANQIKAVDLDTRVSEVANALGLSDLLARRPTELSRGQRQRVAIGQAIVHSPKVLLLDEPASGLDPEARGSLSALFRALQAQGMTLVVSSHILSELDEYCTHILSIRDGHIVSHEALGVQDSLASSDAQATTEAGTAQALPRSLYVLELAPSWVDAHDDDAVLRATQHLSQTLMSAGAQLQAPATAQGLLAPFDPLRPQLWLADTSAAARASLIAALVHAGLPVAGLWPVRERLQDRYAQDLRSAAPIKLSQQSQQEAA